MNAPRETMESSVSFDAGFFKVRTDRVALPDGSTKDYYTVSHPGAVAVVALDSRGRTLLVRQHRQAVDESLLELPAGKLDAGEEPESCARRELEEETGYTCSGLSLLSAYYTSPGFTDEKVYVYLATGLRRVADAPGFDGGEPISIEWLDRGDTLAAVHDGRIVDGKTIVGIALYSLRDGDQPAKQPIQGIP